MKKVHVIFAALVLVSFLFTNCSKENNVIVDEPEIVDPEIDEPEVDDPDDEDQIPETCIINSIKMRGSAQIDFAYTNNANLADQVIESISLSDNGEKVAKGSFKYNAGTMSQVTWFDAQGKIISTITMNANGQPAEQITGRTERVFNYKEGVLENIVTNESDGDIEKLVFKYFPGTAQLVSVTKFRNGRERRTKRFSVTDNNINPFASFGLLLMDFNDFFSDSFWPGFNNPKQIEDSIFDDITFDYNYNVLDMPEFVSWVFFSGSGIEIKNKLEVEYICE